MSVALFGCADAIYRNRVADAVSESRTVSMERLPARNQAFLLYRIGDEGMGLLPRQLSKGVLVSNLNAALIFAPKDVEELRGTYVKMVQALDVKQASGVEFIQYRLTARPEESVARANTVVTPFGATSEYESFRGHRILFELQLKKEAGSYGGPVATYTFRASVPIQLSLDDLRKLAEDLRRE